MTDLIEAADEIFGAYVPAVCSGVVGVHARRRNSDNARHFAAMPGKA